MSESKISYDDDQKRVDAVGSTSEMHPNEVNKPVKRKAAIPEYVTCGLWKNIQEKQ